MGACLSKKKGSSTSSPVSGAKSFPSSTAPVLQSHAELKNYGNGVTLSKPKGEIEPEVNLKKENKTVQEKQEPVHEDGVQVKKEIFIIKHRKSHDDRERNSKQSVLQPDNGLPASAATNEAAAESVGNKIVPATVRTSSCTKEEVDAILIQCGRLSRSSSGKAASSSAASGDRGRRYSGSKRSYDFDHCENDTVSTEDDLKRGANGAATDNSDLCEEIDADKRHQHRQRHRQSPRPSSSPHGRRRTPSRDRDQNQRSSSRERRVSRSPGRRSSETTGSANNAVTNNNGNNGNNNNSTYSRPGKMVSVPATVSSLVMDRSNNGVESAASTGIKRIAVKRNVGGDGGNVMVGSRSAASPRSQSPARANANGNAANAKVLSDNQQQQHSLSRNSSRKAEHSPYRRNPLSEIDPNSLAYPQSNTNNSSNRVQNRPKKEIEAEANQKPNVVGKAVSANCKTKEQQEEETKVLQPSMAENIVVKTMVPSGVDNLKPQKLTRSRSSRRSRDLDLNPEALLNPAQSYTSLLLEDIQNFHQKNNTPSISLPACLTKACSILEAVADLNSTTSYQSTRNEHNVPLSTSTTHYGKRVLDTKDPFVESEVVVGDDVMEPSLHKYVTVKRGGSLGGVDMDDQESSGSNSFTVSGQQNWGVSSSSWEPNSADSTDCWTSRSKSRDEGQESPLGLEENLSSEAMKSKSRECDHQHSSGIGRGRLGGGANKGLHTIPVVTAAAST